MDDNVIFYVDPNKIVEAKQKIREERKTGHNFRISITEKGNERLNELVREAIETAHQKFFKEAYCDNAGLVEIGPDA